MMGALIGLGLGLGLMLAWSAFALPREPSRAARRSRLADLISRSGAGGVTPAGLVGLCAGLGLTVLFLVQGISRTLPVAMVFAVMAAYVPLAVLRSRALRRQREFAQVWPDAVDNLASAVRAGMSLPDAVIALGTHGPEVLREPFVRFGVDYQATGRFGESLDLLKDRLADPIGDRVVEGLRVAREVGGGDLGRLLRNMSLFLREDVRTRSELESRQAWSVNGARLAVAAPWVVLLLMSFQTSVIQRYQSGVGIVVLGLGGLCCFGAYRLMMRIGRLPTERRILA